MAFIREAQLRPYRDLQGVVGAGLLPTLRSCAVQGEHHAGMLKPFPQNSAC
ncbi:TPA: hypothetical protein I8Y12_001603 [Raoultella planticola]|nr:hypothetical protein [Raoultella planticola]